MSSKTQATAEVTVSGGDLRPGIWELNPYASFRNKERSQWNAEVHFVGIDMASASSYTVGDSGALDTSVTLTNRFDRPIHGPVRAALLGAHRTTSHEITGPNKSFQVNLGEGAGGARLNLSMSRQHYNQFTDVAVTVVDAQGKVVARGGFGQRLTSLSFSGSGDYTVKLVGATSDPGAFAPAGVKWTVTVDELHRFSAVNGLAVEAPGGNPVDLFPGVPLKLSLSSKARPVAAPEGFGYLGQITIDDSLDEAGPILREFALELAAQ